MIKILGSKGSCQITETVLNDLITIAKQYKSLIEATGQIKTNKMPMADSINQKVQMAPTINPAVDAASPQAATTAPAA